VDECKPLILGPLKVAMHASALGNIPILAPLTHEQLADLAQSLQIMMFGPGEVVVQGGVADGAMYLVADGVRRCRLTLSDPR